MQRDSVKSLPTIFIQKMVVRIGREQGNGMFSLFVAYKARYALRLPSSFATLNEEY